MTEPITCPKCKKLNINPTGAPDEACPHCGVIYAKVLAHHTNQSRPATPPSVSAPPTARRAQRRDTGTDFVEQLRGQSAYPTFRAVVTISTIIGYVFGVVTLIGGLIVAWRAESYGLFFGTLVVGIGSLVMTRVFKEVAMMFADMSDATIRTARRAEGYDE